MKKNYKLISVLLSVVVSAVLVFSSVASVLLSTAREYFASSKFDVRVKNTDLSSLTFVYNGEKITLERYVKDYVNTNIDNHVLDKASAYFSDLWFPIADALTDFTVDKVFSSEYVNKLVKNEIKEIDSQFEEIQKTAKENDYSVNRWLRLQLGYGVTEKLIRDLTEDMYLAQKYYDKVTEDTTNAVTPDRIDKEYADNKDDYDVVDLRIYAFIPDLGSNHKHEEGEGHDKEHEKAEAEAKKKAEAFLAKATDEEKFIEAAKVEILTADNKSKKDPDASTLVEKAKYASLTSSYDEAIAKWVYDDARKAGEVAVVVGENGTPYVIMMKNVPHKDTSIYSSDVRHILVQFPDKNTDGTATSVKDDKGNTTKNITDATKKATKEKAQAILDEYLKNPTEENFAKLAKEKTEDPGSKETGGLYEGVMNDGKYVKPFTDWSIADGRKVGDTGIVETDYGYHIMYFVKAGNQNWYQAVQTALVGAEIEAGVAKELDDCVHSVKLDSFFINWTLKRENKHISNIIVNNFGASHAGHDH